MLEPRRAPVRPRVVSPVSGETLLLEDEILSLLERGETGIVWLAGGPGSGKTTALAHLAAVIPQSCGLVLRDTDDPPVQNPARLIVRCSDTDDVPASAKLGYRLVPWTEDEVIEYLLTAHRQRCSSVMQRYHDSEDSDLLSGNPELWRDVLDQLAVDDAIPTVKDASRRLLDLRLTDRSTRVRVSSWCLGLLQVTAGVNASLGLMGAKYGWDFDDAWNFAEWIRLIRHEGVMLLLAAERFADELCSTERCPFLEYSFPREVIDQTGALIRGNERVLDRLRVVMVSSRRESQPTAASLLHAARVDWRPELLAISGLRKLIAGRKASVPRLQGAFLEGAQWPGINLSRADLDAADLSHADLRNSNLDGAVARGTNLQSAKFSGASLERFDADDAKLAAADLSHARAAHSSFIAANAERACFEGALLKKASFRDARLGHANFTRADLSGAAFIGAEINEADFTQATLDQALLTGLTLHIANFRQCNFRLAEMSGCDLEGMVLPGADFSSANLKGALLTGTVMPRADFHRAVLENAGLAEIDWEQSDLRDADLRGASFHMGSSRSGLVDSTIASFGSRTGFYTDDFNEQDFKTPEEIRKANLRGADLRGANIDGVDFYLVDLRDARYDASQERQFRSCGEILESRVP